MSATQRFHEIANDALVRISNNLWDGAKLALVIYTPNEPGKDIVLKDQGLDLDEVLSTLRRSGLSIDGDNAYKRDLLDVITGAMAFGFQGVNPPPEGHWGKRFWDIARAEGLERDQLREQIRSGELTADASEVLRAELIEARRNEHNSEVAYRAAIEKQDEIRADRDSANQRADAAERKLGEAVGLLREARVIMGFVGMQDHLVNYDLAGDVRAKVKGFLSASAEPAECGCCGQSDRCDDDCDVAKPAKGGDGEADHA